jgi:translation elongation factor EF-1beta
MRDEPISGIKEIEIEMVIRDKNGNIKHIDHEVKKLGKTR